MDSPFELNERVAILTVDDDGETLARYGRVKIIEDGAIHVSHSSGLPFFTFMYSAPDDMWLRVVPEGEAVECTRLAKVVLSERNVSMPVNKGMVNHLADGVFWDGILQEVRARLRENKGL